MQWHVQRCCSHWATLIQATLVQESDRGRKAKNAHLVQDEHLGGSQHSAGHAQQLPLPCGEVAARLCHRSIQSALDTSC